MKKLSFFLLSTLSITNLFSQSGLPDENFGSGGILTINTDSTSAINAIAVQEDGKIILAGYDYNGYNFDFALYRLLPDGSPDYGFGTNGKTLTDFSEQDKANSIQIQPDNKILLGGLAANGTSFAIARYNSDGTPDNSFGLNGKILSGTGFGYEREVTLLLQPDGKIIIVGNDNNFIDNYCDMIRYNSDGSVDHTFSTGKDTLKGYFDCAALQTDGNILVGGYIKVAPGNYDCFIARFNSSGSLDTTFSYDGKVQIDFSTGDNINSMAIQNDHKIVVAGTILQGQVAYRSVLARINPNGLLDDSFGNHGKVIRDTSGFISEGINSLLIQPDNKIVTAGFGISNAHDFKLYRFNENGTLDNSFGTNGIILKNDLFNNADCEALSLALQPDGKILAAGYTNKNYTKKMMAMRFTSGLSSVSDMKDEQISVFPNPFVNELNINIPEIISNTLVRITDLQGQVIYYQQINTENETIDPGKIDAGVYLLTIINTTHNFSTLIIKI